MCQCQKRRNECFHVCMQLVLNPCTHHKFRKWWLLICTARNSLVVLTCNVLESLSKICTHFAQTMQHSYLSVLRAEKGFVFGCSNSMLENTIHLLIYMAHIIWPMCYLKFTYLSIESDLIQSSLTCFSLSNRSINFSEHTYLHAYLSISSSICISVYHLI